MGNGPRFVLSASGQRDFAISENAVWPAGGISQSSHKTRIGCRCSLSATSPISQLSDLPTGSFQQHFKNFVVNVLVREAKVSIFLRYVIVDLWTEHDSATSSGIDGAIGALEHVRRLTGQTLRSGWGEKLETQQEFVEIILPKIVVSRLDTEQIRSEIILASDPHVGYGDRLPTLELAGNRLRFGPEPPGAARGLQRLLAREANEQVSATQLELPRYRYLAFLPFVTAGLLLCGWLFPLSWLAVAVASVAMAACLSAGLLPARKVGWKVLLRQSCTIGTLGFVGIGAFGIAYAICAILDPGSLGETTAFGSGFAHGASFGYAVLVSCSFGIAGGVFGDAPSGIARIVAHIQLLLFVGGVAAAIATVLRIDRNAEQRERRG